MKRLALSLLLVSCDDALDQRLAIVTEPRVLAVISDPAEAKPKAMVTYTEIAASPDGPLLDIPHWAYCTAPKPPTEDNAVPDGCVTGDQLIDLGSAPAVTAMLPADGCLTYGPDTPPGGFRPRDADSTGGYYQPIRADVATSAAGGGPIVSFGLSRITCNLPTAPGDLAQRYRLEYVANANPSLDPMQTLTGIDRVAAHSTVMLTAAWPDAAAESYLYFDTLDQVLVDRRESMRVSWFATDGSIAVDASVVGEDDPSTSAATTWSTPGPGPAHVWAVLRDSRGGIAVRDLQVIVE